MSKPNIIISGDSWGLGELPYQSRMEADGTLIKSVIHKGIEQYFIDYGYNVINLSVGGSSNVDSIKRLQILSRSLIEQKRINADDIVLWIMSDPFRDTNSGTLTQEIENAQGVRPLLNNLMHKSFDALNQIGHPIHLIGGLCNINTDISSQYNNLITVIPSWVNLLVRHMPEYEYTKNKDFVMTPGVVIQKIHLSKLNKNLAISIINDLYSIEKNFKVFAEDIFHPDGCHPNRQGHRIAFDKIIEALEIDINSK